MVRCAGRALGSLMGKNFLAHEIHICASLRTQFISHQGYPEVFKPWMFSCKCVCVFHRKCTLI